MGAVKQFCFLPASLCTNWPFVGAIRYKIPYAGSPVHLWWRIQIEGEPASASAEFLIAVVGAH